MSLGPLPEEWIQWKGLSTRSSLIGLITEDRVPDPKFNLASTIEDFRPDIGQAERELVYSIMKKVFFYLLPS